MFQCIKYEDKREVFGFKIHSFSTHDRIKKYDDSDNEENAEKPYSIEVGETKRTINLYATQKRISGSRPSHKKAKRSRRLSGRIRAASILAFSERFLPEAAR